MDKNENQEHSKILDTLPNNMTYSISNVNKHLNKQKDDENSNHENNINNQTGNNNENEENLFSDVSSEESKVQSSRSHSRSPSYDDRRRRKRSKSRSRSPRIKRLKCEDDKDEANNFVMKNGCCRDCMRAFSKSGKSCLCQVPKYERKYTLPDNGCNICGCTGNCLILF